MKNTSLKQNIKNINSHSISTSTSTNAAEIRGNKQPQAYRWTIETALGTFTGTCLSINDLNNEITMLTNKAKIIKKNITPSTQINDNREDKIYTWNVITHSGQASGVSVSLEEARKVINSFGYKDVVKSKITQSPATPI